MEQKQIQRLGDAQDALNPYEKTLYGVLWRAPQLRTDQDQQDPDSRLVQAGYDYLMKECSFAKKTVQRLIPRLIDKDFVSIEQAPAISTRTPTLYRVHSFGYIKQMNRRRGRLFVAKLGRGIAFARPASSTVDNPPLSTVVRETTVTPLSTVVSRTTLPYKELSTQERTTTTTELADAFDKADCLLDAPAVERVHRHVTGLMPDVTPEEVVTPFVERLRGLHRQRRVDNPVGVLLDDPRIWFDPRRVQQGREERAAAIRQNEELQKELRELGNWAADPKKTVQ